jgi:hypothetical protein
LGTISVDFEATDLLLSTYSTFVKYWEYNEAVRQILIDSMKAYDSVRREVLYTIFSLSMVSP